MYHLLKEDAWGNKVPYVTVSDKETATRLMKDGYARKVIEVPRSKSTIIMM